MDEYDPFNPTNEEGSLKELTPDEERAINEDEFSESGESRDDMEGSEDDEDEEDEYNDDEVGEEDEIMEEDELGAVGGSESEDDGAERCSVCLCNFSGQDVGTPETCDHSFCLDCIQEWAKNVNTCPADRTVFHLIMARHGLNGDIYMRIPVEDRNLLRDDDDDGVGDADATNCEVCGHSDREDRLLLCDGCDAGYHLDCLTPPLRHVPVEEWFCDECASKNKAALMPATRGHHRRQIARTIVSERVRAHLQESRLRQTRSGRILTRDSDDGDEEVEQEGFVSARDLARASTSAGPQLVTIRKARGSKKRKYRKRRSGSKKSVRRRGKRRLKRRSAQSAVPTAIIKTPKTRIAGLLGIVKPKAGKTIPEIRQKVDRQMGSDASASCPLSIMGDRNELIAFNDSDDETATMPTFAKKPISRYSAMSRLSNRPIQPPLSSRVSRRPITVSAATSAPTSNCDILGSIMQGQALLHKDAQQVTIKRDGSLQLKTGETAKSFPTNRSSASLDTTKKLVSFEGAKTREFRASEFQTIDEAVSECASSGNPDSLKAVDGDGLNAKGSDSVLDDDSVTSTARSLADEPSSACGDHEGSEIELDVNDEDADANQEEVKALETDEESQQNGESDANEQDDDDDDETNEADNEPHCKDDFASEDVVEQLEAEAEHVVAENEHVETEDEHVEAEDEQVEAEDEQVEAEDEEAEAEDEQVEAEDEHAEEDEEPVEAEAETEHDELDDEHVEAEDEQVDPEDVGNEEAEMGSDGQEMDEEGKDIAVDEEGEEVGVDDEEVEDGVIDDEQESGEEHELMETENGDEEQEVQEEDEEDLENAEEACEQAEGEVSDENDKVEMGVEEEEEIEEEVEEFEQEEAESERAETPGLEENVDDNEDENERDGTPDLEEDRVKKLGSIHDYETKRTPNRRLSEDSRIVQKRVSGTSGRIQRTSDTMVLYDDLGEEGEADLDQETMDEYAPKIPISEFPRIPKLKKNRLQVEIRNGSKDKEEIWDDWRRKDDRKERRRDDWEVDDRPEKRKYKDDRNDERDRYDKRDRERVKDKRRSLSRDRTRSRRSRSRDEWKRRDRVSEERWRSRSRDRAKRKRRERDREREDSRERSQDRRTRRKREKDDVDSKRPLSPKRKREIGKDEFGRDLSSRDRYDRSDRRHRSRSSEKYQKDYFQHDNRESREPLNRETRDTRSETSSRREETSSRREDTKVDLRRDSRYRDDREYSRRRSKRGDDDVAEFADEGDYREKYYKNEKNPDKADKYRPRDEKYETVTYSRGSKYEEKGSAMYNEKSEKYRYKDSKKYADGSEDYIEEKPRKVSIELSDEEDDYHGKEYERKEHDYHTSSGKDSRKSAREHEREEPVAQSIPTVGSSSLGHDSDNQLVDMDLTYDPAEPTDDVTPSPPIDALVMDEDQFEPTRESVLVTVPVADQPHFTPSEPPPPLSIWHPGTSSGEMIRAPHPMQMIHPQHLQNLHPNLRQQLLLNPMLINQLPMIQQIPQGALRHMHLPPSILQQNRMMMPQMLPHRLQFDPNVDPSRLLHPPLEQLVPNRPPPQLSFMTEPPKTQTTQLPSAEIMRTMPPPRLPQQQQQQQQLIHKPVPVNKPEKPKTPDTLIPAPKKSPKASSTPDAKGQDSIATLERIKTLGSLLNSQVALASLASIKTDSKDSQFKTPMPKKDGAKKVDFKVPPPPRLSRDDKPEELVIDMDVASPTLDDMEFSFSPPPLEDGAKEHTESKKLRSGKDGKKDRGKENKKEKEDSAKKSKKVDWLPSDALKDNDWISGIKKDASSSEKPSSKVVVHQTSAQTRSGIAVEPSSPKSPSVPAMSDKFIKKMNRQERVIEEVKLAIKPHYAAKKISKEEYKDILRKSVPKICHSKSGDINPAKIKKFIDTYVGKMRKRHKNGEAGDDVTTSPIMDSFDLARKSVTPEKSNPPLFGKPIKISKSDKKENATKNGPATSRASSGAKKAKSGHSHREKKKKAH